MTLKLDHQVILSVWLEAYGAGGPHIKCLTTKRYSLHCIHYIQTSHSAFSFLHNLSRYYEYYVANYCPKTDANALQKEGHQRQEIALILTHSKEASHIFNKNHYIYAADGPDKKVCNVLT